MSPVFQFRPLLPSIRLAASVGHAPERNRSLSYLARDHGRIRRPPDAGRVITPAGETSVCRLDRIAPFYMMLIVILLSQSVEAFLGRNISLGIMGKLTLLFTAIAVLITVIPAIFLRLKTFCFTLWVNLPFQIYSIVALLSTTWSLYPEETLKASITLICFHLTGTAIASMFSWRAIWLGLAWGILFLAVCSIVIIPHDGLMTDVQAGSFRGLWMEKNAAGEAMAIGAMACMVVAVADRNPKYLLGMVLLIGLTLYARAAGALAASCVAIAFIVFVETLRKRPVRFFTGTWLAVVIVGLIGLYIAHLGTGAASVLGRDSSLTGRTLIWPTVIRYIQESPLLGYGFQAFWVDGSDTKAEVMRNADFEAFNAHNSYLELMLGFGALGCFFIGSAVLRAIFQSTTALFGSDDARRFALAFIIYGLLSSLTESMLGDAAGLAAFVMGVLVPKTALGYARSRGHFRL